MAAKKGAFQTSVGYVRLPSRTMAGSRASYNKAFSKSARESMAEVIRRVSAIFEAEKNVLPEVLEAALVPTFALSQVYCPVKTGTLVESGDLSSGVSKGKAFASIKYGDGGKVRYAAMVHERTDLNHVFPTRAKFLQAALEEDVGYLRSRIVFLLRGDQ